MRPKPILIALLAAILLGTAALPSADAAGSRASRQVNRTLNRLSDKRDTQLRDNSRRARTERQQQAREQAQPGNPQNRTRKQAEQTRNRLDNIRDKQVDQQNAQNRDAEQ